MAGDTLLLRQGGCYLAHGQSYACVVAGASAPRGPQLVQLPLSNLHGLPAVTARRVLGQLAVQAIVAL